MLLPRGRSRPAWEIVATEFSFPGIVGKQLAKLKISAFRRARTGRAGCRRKIRKKLIQRMNR
jgi:hypothetical protein